jgi:anti-sigma factor RsiW
MYHAPVNLDLEEQDAEPAEIAEHGVGMDASSQRLREAHLHNGQAQTRACSHFFRHRRRRRLLVAWAMFGGVRFALIGGGCGVGSSGMARAVREGEAANSRSGQGRAWSARSARPSASPLSGRVFQSTPSPRFRMKFR